MDERESNLPHVRDCGVFTDAVQGGHGLKADFLMAPTAIRLFSEGVGPVVLRVALENMNGSDLVELQVRPGRAMVFGDEWQLVPAEEITELAAVGVAFIVLAALTPLRAVRLASRGQRFDFWLEHQETKQQFALEVAGRRTGDCKRLSQLKVKQMELNPFGIDGYVVTCIFTPGVLDVCMAFVEALKHES